jgi:NAD(P)-dependent dehydrogenase (short-subunit alcohol dehydrogenase family)
MAGRVLITGANGSLALNAVEYFLRAFPELTLLLTVRDESDEDPNTTQLRRLIAKHPEASISVLKLDLNSLKEVAGFCNQVAAEIESSRVPRLIAIICNEVYIRDSLVDQTSRTMGLSSLWRSITLHILHYPYVCYAIPV